MGQTAPGAPALHQSPAEIIAAPVIGNTAPIVGETAPARRGLPVAITEGGVVITEGGVVATEGGVAAAGTPVATAEGAMDGAVSQAVRLCRTGGVLLSKTPMRQSATAGGDRHLCAPFPAHWFHGGLLVLAVLMSSFSPSVVSR